MSQTRKNGFEKPFSKDQLITWGVESVNFIFFIVLTAVLPEGSQRGAVFGTLFPLIAVFIGCFVFLGITDPSVATEPSCKFRRNDHSFYCRYCKKSIPGFDHHCTWLNTCIGRRNYLYFYVMSVLGTLISLLQMIFGIVSLARWYKSNAAHYIFVIIYILLNLAVCGAFFSLFSFHTYIIFNKSSTYHYLESKRPRPPSANTSRSGEDHRPVNVPAVSEKPYELPHPQLQPNPPAPTITNDQPSLPINLHSSNSVNIERSSQDNSFTDNFSKTQPITVVSDGSIINEPPPDILRPSTPLPFNQTLPGPPMTQSSTTLSPDLSGNSKIHDGGDRLASTSGNLKPTASNNLSTPFRKSRSIKTLMSNGGPANAMQVPNPNKSRTNNSNISGI